MLINHCEESEPWLLESASCDFASNLAFKPLSKEKSADSFHSSKATHPSSGIVSEKPPLDLELNEQSDDIIKSSSSTSQKEKASWIPQSINDVYAMSSRSLLENLQWSVNPQHRISWTKETSRDWKAGYYLDANNETDECFPVSADEGLSKTLSERIDCKIKDDVNQKESKELFWHKIYPNLSDSDGQSNIGCMNLFLHNGSIRSQPYEDSHHSAESFSEFGTIKSSQMKDKSKDGKVWDLNSKWSSKDSVSYLELEEMLDNMLYQPASDKTSEMKDSNKIKMFEYSEKFIDANSLASNNQPTIDENLIEALIPDDLCNSKRKRFSQKYDTAKSRAWEVIQKNSNKLCQNDSSLLDVISKVKRNQNIGNFKSKTSKIFSLMVNKEIESNTAHSSQKSASIPVQTPVITVSPSKLEQKIIRMFRRYYKCKFEEGLKAQGVNFKRQAGKMTKEEFIENILTFMDRTFDVLLDQLDKNTLDKVIWALCLFILKERQSRDAVLWDNLDFRELNSLTNNPNAKKTLTFFSKKENAFLFAFFFLFELKQLTTDPLEACWYKGASQRDETLVLYYQMHELYNEVVAFVPAGVQELVNEEVNKYLSKVAL